MTRLCTLFDAQQFLSFILLMDGYVDSLTARHFFDVLARDDSGAGSSSFRRSRTTRDFLFLALFSE